MTRFGKHLIVGSSIVISLVLFVYICTRVEEGFTSVHPEQITGKIRDDILVTDEFPYSGNNGVSDANASDIWQRREVGGSFEQKTNNPRYVANPDIQGTCTPSLFCDALYDNKSNVQSNEVYPLPPVHLQTDKSRINYFQSESPPLLAFSGNLA